MIYTFVGALDEGDTFGSIRGNGKTASMTYYALAFYNAGYTILSNYKTLFSEYLNSKEIRKKIFEEDLHYIVICIDELQLLLNSLGEKKTLIIDFVHELLAQTRKRDVESFCTSQRYFDLHKRFRSQNDICLRPYKFHTIDEDIVIELISNEEDFIPYLCLKDRCPYEHTIAIFQLINPSMNLLNRGRQILFTEEESSNYFPEDIKISPIFRAKEIGKLYNQFQIIKKEEV